MIKEDLSVPGFPDVYVLGDSAHFKDEKAKPLPALASVAKQQGEYLGKVTGYRSFASTNQKTF